MPQTDGVVRTHTLMYTTLDSGTKRHGSYKIRNEHTKRRTTSLTKPRTKHLAKRQQACRSAENKRTDGNRDSHHQTSNDSQYSKRNVTPVLRKLAADHPPPENDAAARRHTCPFATAPSPPPGERQREGDPAGTLCHPARRYWPNDVGLRTNIVLHPRPTGRPANGVPQPQAHEVDTTQAGLLVS